MAFETAKIGTICSSVDDTIRQTLSEARLSSGYDLPGLLHRVRHGTGLDIHQYPYLVRGSQIQPLEGIVVSKEPLICIPDKFGIRHEDYFLNNKKRPKWFTV